MGHARLDGFPASCHRPERAPRASMPHGSKSCPSTSPSRPGLSEFGSQAQPGRQFLRVSCHALQAIDNVGAERDSNPRASDLAASTYPLEGRGVGRPRPDLSPPRRTFRPGSTPGTRMPPNRSECAPTWAAPLLLPLPLLLLLPRHSQPTASNDDTRRMRTRAGSVHRLGGRRLGRSAKVSSARHMAIGNCRRTMRDARCGFPAATQI
jgi:hypothetical protein